MTDDSKFAPFDDNVDLEPYLTEIDAVVGGLAIRYVTSLPTDDIIAMQMPSYYVAEARFWARHKATSERAVLMWAGAALRAEERMCWSADEARAVALAYLEGWQDNPKSVPASVRIQGALKAIVDGIAEACRGPRPMAVGLTRDGFTLTDGGDLR